jgi:hypothetical protein
MIYCTTNSITRESSGFSHFSKWPADSVSRLLLDATCQSVVYFLPYYLKL